LVRGRVAQVPGFRNCQMLHEAEQIRSPADQRAADACAYLGQPGCVPQIRVGRQSIRWEERYVDAVATNSRRRGLPERIANHGRPHLGG